MYEYSTDGIACVLKHSSSPKEVLSNCFYTPQRQTSPWHLESNIYPRVLLLWVHFLPDPWRGLPIRAAHILLQNSRGIFLVPPEARTEWPGSKEGWKRPHVQLHTFSNSNQWPYNNFLQMKKKPSTGQPQQRNWIVTKQPMIKIYEEFSLY